MEFPAVFLLTLMLARWAQSERQECEQTVTAVLQQVLLKSSLDDLVNRLVEIEKKLVTFGEELRLIGREGYNRSINGVQGSEADHCPPKFTLVYGRCVWADTATRGYWPEVRQRCLSIGADLVIVDSAEFLWHLVQHLHAIGADKESYYVGGWKDETGVWKWVDNSPMRLGTPFFGYGNDFKYRQPVKEEYYIIMYQPGFYFLHSTVSQWKKVHPICQMFAEGLSKISKH